MPEQVTFDHYELLTRGDGSLFELGRGAMGITYKAFDSNLRVPVALKVINVPDLTSDLARTRFVQEARAAAKLRHRHVASVFHLGTQGDTYFYAMEFIGGETVEALVKRRGPLPEIVALQICVQVARALAAAAQHSLVHRDIKPSNLMLVYEDDELCTKVIDFGLAKSELGEDEEGSSFSTTSTGFMGTPNFASPEQLEEKEIDHRSDIYSLGATLWYMLTGSPPFTGPVARVVSQHLSVEPAYEKLTCSAQTVALLRKMLAKDRVQRFQKAIEVRQAIEQCSENIAGSAVAAAARLALEESRVGPGTNDEREAGDYPAGASIAERYEVVNPLGATNGGWTYQARDVAGQRDVRLVLVDVDPAEDRAAFTQLELELETLIQLEHPNLLRVYGMETVERRVLFSLEWTNGITLLQLLRTRRKLHAGEVMLLLERMAAGVDYAISRGLGQLDLSLHQVHLEFPGAAADLGWQLTQPVDTWTSFNLKLNPLAVTLELAQSQTWAGGQTLVAGSASEVTAEVAPIERGVAHTRSLAMLVYELLGGSVSPLLSARAGAHGIARLPPLAYLTEGGNDVLRRALDPDGPFRSAGEFHRALSIVDELEDRHYETPEIKVAEGNSTALTQFEEKPVATLPLHVPAAGRTRWVLIGAAVVVIGGAGAFFLLRPGRDDSAGNGTQTLSSTVEVTAPNVPATPGTVETGNTPVATPVPVPTRRDLLKAAMSEAEKVEEEGDSSKTIAAWLDVARTYPEAEIGRMRLETVLDGLRAKVPQLSGSELAQLESEARAAAKLEVVSAMILLGEMAREKSPQESYKWFSAAAAKGVPAAETQVGLMLSNGLGVERDLVKAVEFFQSAARKGDVSAKAALGECLLYGKGVEKDPPRAIELLEQAASRNNLRALNRLGTCYHKGVGVKEDYAEAMRLFKKAVDLGSGEAYGNLGVLYMNGDGVPKNQQKAVELFQQGAESGDGYCMYLYARCFESGTGVTPNPITAQLWYKKAAVLGIIKAQDWCKKNGVAY